MDRWALPVVVTAALLGASSIASAQGAPTGAAYAPPGYSLTVPSSPMVAMTGVAPAPSRPETQSIRGLWIPGLVGLPISYVTTWIVASVTLPAGSGASDLAYIPVIGPWLMLGQDLNGDSPEFYVTMGVVQGISLVCLVLGLAIRIPKARTDAPTLSLRPSSSGAMSATLQF
jgi:hypothetical protein